MSKRMFQAKPKFDQLAVTQKEPGLTILPDTNVSGEESLKINKVLSNNKSIKLSNEAVVREWISLNSPFEENLWYGANFGAVTEVKQYDGSLVLVSVHAINHYTGTSLTDYKHADLHTGGLVRLLSESTCTTSVINFRRTALMNPFLGETLADVAIKDLYEGSNAEYLLDIHGAKNGLGFDVAIGTAREDITQEQAVVIEIALKIFSEQRIKVSVNPIGFRAHHSQSIVHRALESGVSGAVQIELARLYRDPTENQAYAVDMFSCLQQLCLEINKLSTIIPSSSSAG